MNKPKQHDVIVQAVNELKGSEYGATAIKVELEAQIDRHEECEDIQQGILSRLEHLGLAEYDEGNEWWNAKLPLVYAEVYDDGSVDTELTFTLSLNNPENVLMLPDIIKAFKDICYDSGNDFRTDRAGMHIALLNNRAMTYPAERLKPYDTVRFKNFRKSMIRLLPALYFLGSHTPYTREMAFRRPQIERCEVDTNHHYDEESQKYSAVAFRHGAVEFRVFDTCYDNPEAILDNIVVMSKAMRFWTRAYTRNNLPAMPNTVKWGLNSGGRLEGLYSTYEHIDLLHGGLNLLKPDYFTINELKKQRNFSVTKTSINTKLREARKQALKNYIEYEQRFKWETVLEEQNAIRAYLREYVEGYKKGECTEAELTRIRNEAKKQAKVYEKNKQKRTSFVKERIDRDIPKGRWPLDESDPVIESARAGVLTTDEIMERVGYVDLRINPISSEWSPQ